MAVDTKISDLPAATSIGDTNLIPIVQGGITKKATQNQVCTKIYDGSHVLAADFGARTFYGTNGTDPVIVIDSSNTARISQIGDITGTHLIYWNGSAWEFDDPTAFGGGITDSTPLLSVEINNRQLIASNGSTVALDWSDPGLLKAFGFDLISSGGVFLIPIAQLDNGAFTFGYGDAGFQPLSSDSAIASQNSSTYFDNSGFHGTGSVAADTGWTANSDAGDKTKVVGSAATLAAIATALDLVTSGAGTQLKNIGEKVKALETVLVASKIPNA